MSRKKKPAPSARQKPEPGPRNKELIADAMKRHVSRPVRTYVKIEPCEDGNITAAAPHTDETGHTAALLDAFGTTSGKFLCWSMGELDNVTRRRGTERGEDPSSLNAGLALIQAIGPQDELEAALASQMAGCHALTMELLGRAKSTDRTDHLAMYGNLAIKLQRTFTAQIEALGRLRGKGQQVVRVEHVTVQPGGQAIVGDVHHHPRGTPGGKTENEGSPHETTSTAPTQAREALPSPDPARNGVPVPSNAERPVQAPRRTVARRARKPKRV